MTVSLLNNLIVKQARVHVLEIKDGRICLHLDWPNWQDHLIACILNWVKISSIYTCCGQCRIPLHWYNTFGFFPIVLSRHECFLLKTQAICANGSRLYKDQRLDTNLMFWWQIRDSTVLDSKIHI